MSGFIVKARDMRTRKLWYYTGRAGEEWLSADRAAAFVYATSGEAERKCDMFQRQHPDRPWMIEHANPADAHVAAVRSMSSDACGAVDWQGED